MSPDEWMEVYRKLVYWELELQDTGGAMDEVLKMQKEEADVAFCQVCEKKLYVVDGKPRQTTNDEQRPVSQKGLSAFGQGVKRCS